MAFDVQGKTVLITGANRGIGKTFLDHMLKAGAAKVYAAVRNPDSMTDIVEASGGKVAAVQLDLSNEDTINAVAQNLEKVDLVINNAGVLKVATPFSDDVFECFDFEMDVNVKGLIRMARAFAPLLEKSSGVFVQLNSVASLRNFADFATYSASKAASYSITQALRDMLAPKGVRVISVHPGPIMTDMGKEAGLEEMAESPDLVAEGLVKALGTDEFHVFPDTMAKNFWQAYKSFAKGVVESEASEG
ncbi:putative oxidoreductase [Polystyrenella longa]|uniref:Putative oxidoreductase n=1 Tax=Polystyrenella longa TaxID=2528007 RepID=A0A518CJL6_9PLAN|nr:SDR family oxidoreductase [Polystyrenella longa]QDU79426.1 putative oxidoreductase [Polystyrenella longa]